jgi:hypothetical protein
MCRFSVIVIGLHVVVLFALRRASVTSRLPWPGVRLP